MSTNPSPFDDGNQPFDSTLTTALQQVEKIFQDYEPKVRELNRKFTDVLGRHPSSEDGQWVFLATNEQGEYFFGLESISIEHFSKLVCVLGDIGELLEDSPIHSRSNSEPLTDLGPMIIGDAAKLTYVPTTHIRVKRDQQ